MAYWIEIHCDVRKEQATPTGGPACFSESNNSHGVRVESASNIKGAVAMLSRKIESLGWHRNGRTGEWCCPACKKIAGGSDE